MSGIYWERVRMAEQALIKLGSGGVFVYHDDDCDVLNGGSVCDCDPDITIRTLAGETYTVDAYGSVCRTAS